MMAETCERLVAAGLPLWRVGVFVRTLHPDIFGRNFIWRPGAEVEVGTVGFQHSGSAGISQSARCRSCSARARRCRARVDDPDSGRFPDRRRHARRGRHRLHRAAAAVHRRLGPRLELDHEAAGRLHRRAARPRCARWCAALARVVEIIQWRRTVVAAARHLCRQPRRRANPERPDPARPYRDHECRDLAVRSARFYRAVGPAAGRDRGRYPEQLFRLPGRRDQGAWRRGAEIHGRRAARGVSDRRICRRLPAGLQPRAGSRPRIPRQRRGDALSDRRRPSSASASASRCMSGKFCTAISAAATGSTSPASVPPSIWRRGWRRSPAKLSRTIVASAGFAGICAGGWDDLGEFPIAGFSKAERVYGLLDEEAAAADDG